MKHSGLRDEPVEIDVEGPNGSVEGHGAPLPSKLVSKVQEGVAGLSDGYMDRVRRAHVAPQVGGFTSTALGPPLKRNLKCSKGSSGRFANVAVS